MKKSLLLVVIFTLVNIIDLHAQISNPLLMQPENSFLAPELNKIEPEYFIEAFNIALKEANSELEEIYSNRKKATFSNTIEALELSTIRMYDIMKIFYNLYGVNGGSEMVKIESEISSKLSKYSNDLYLNPELFKRVQTIYKKRDRLKLSTEELALLTKYYKSFIKRGALLSDDEQMRFREISGEISALSSKFSSNVRSSNDNFILHVTDHSKIADLPPFMIGIATREAKMRGLDGWVFTLKFSCFGPFLKFSSNSELKEKIWRGYYGLAYNDKWDNSEYVKQIANLRLELAQLMGYNSYAEYILEDRMVGSVERVSSFLNNLSKESVPLAEAEYEAVNSFAKEKYGLTHDLKPWDWIYYSDKYKASLFSFNDNMLKPYFEFNSVLDGVFKLIEKLYGISFIPKKSLPKYSDDLVIYEVKEGDKHIALLYLDLFTRKGKNPGGWMSSYRDAHQNREGDEVRPIISVSANIMKPEEGKPALLSFMDLSTLLHEMGHAMHGIFAEGRYMSLSGTSVARDFVELPAQIMENWAYEPEFYELWAEHYETGVKMPKELINSMIKSKRFLLAYKSIRQLNLAAIDLAIHSITEPITGGVEAFEREVIKNMQVGVDVSGVSTLTSFSHIFDGGYACAYYGYKWSEMLDIDGFKEYKESGNIFDRETANRFRECILSKGGTEDAMELYIKFRGQEPSVNSLIDKIKSK